MDIELILQERDEHTPSHADLVKIKEAIEALGFYVNDLPSVKRIVSVAPALSGQSRRIPTSANAARFIVECDVCGCAAPESEFVVVDGESGDGHTYHLERPGWGLHPILMQEGETRAQAIERGKRISANDDLKFRPA